MNSNQQIRAHALRIAAGLETTDGLRETIDTAEIFAKYIADGFGSLDVEGEMKRVSASRIALEAYRATSLGQIMAAEEQADRGDLVSVTVKMNGGFGPLGEWLEFRKRELTQQVSPAPQSEQPTPQIETQQPDQDPAAAGPLLANQYLGHELGL